MFAEFHKPESFGFSEDYVTAFILSGFVPHYSTFGDFGILRRVSHAQFAQIIVSIGEWKVVDLKKGAFSA